MNFERTVATEISSDVMLSKVGLGVPLTLYRVCHRQSALQKGSLVNGHFNKLKKLSDTLEGGHATMACNSNAAVATIDSWLSSKTIRTHVANE